MGGGLTCAVRREADQEHEGGEQGAKTEATSDHHAPLEHETGTAMAQGGALVQPVAADQVARGDRHQADEHAPEEVDDAWGKDWL